jgi:hypothetical protein
MLPMTSTRLRSILPHAGITALVWFVWFIGNTLGVLASALQVEQSSMSLFLYSFLIGGSLAFWVYKDSHSTGVSTGLDQVFFIFLAWPILFPLYFFQSRGFGSGSLLLLIFIGPYILSLIPALLIGMAIVFARSFLSKG